MYVAYAEEVATLHSEALGFGRAWTLAQGGTWVVRKHEITYFLSATAGDELELTTEVAELRGARAVRLTRMRRVADGARVAELRTEWVWLRADGKPTRVPAELLSAFDS